MVGRIPVMDVTPVVDLGRQPGQGHRRRALPRARHRCSARATTSSAPRWSLTDPTASAGRRCGCTRADDVPDRYARWVTPDVDGRLDLRDPGLVRPARDLAARRRHQDPRRRRRRADVHRGPAAARAGPRLARPQDDAPTRRSSGRGDRRRRRDTSAPGRGPARGAAGRRAAPTCSPRTRCASWSRVEGPFPVVRRPRARALRQLVRVLPALRGRHARREDRHGHQRHLPHRRRAARRGRRDGLRRHLPAADPPDRRGQPQGPQQHPDPRPGRPRLAVGDRQPRTAATTPSTPTSARFEDFDAFVARAGELGLEVALDLALQAAPDHPWVTDAPGVVHHPRRRHDRLRREPAEEVPGHLPDQLRQRPRRASAARCCGSSGSGWRTACGSSASTTRTPSRWRSGSGCSARSARTDPDVLFLSEAFTRPAMMHGLGAVGFHQCYTYFTWRTAQVGARGLPHARCRTSPTT